MAQFRLAPASELSGLQQQLVNTLEQIDFALDRGDRRAFRIWAGKYATLSSRCASLLLRIATTDG